MGMTADPGVMDLVGSSRAAFTPIPSSPLIDSGTPFVDRNGGMPGLSSGNGTDRGAIEL